MHKLNKIFIRVVQASTLVLSLLLFWFAFVYYPKTIENIQTGKFEFGHKIFDSVTASSYVFPIETEGYKIEKSGDGASYYVFVSGGDLVQYEANRNNARLALKTALSVEDTCSISVVYVSSSKLNVPESLKSGDCTK